MKLAMDLACQSRPEWLHTVLNNFDEFLQDHADCERKASAMAMSFVAKFPDRVEILPTLIDTAIEELEHFQQVYAVMEARGVLLPKKMRSDPYVSELVKHCRSTREERFLDRLLLASIVEMRGAERFRMIADGLQDETLKKFYKDLWISEAKHGHIFVKMALNYFDKANIDERLAAFVKIEADVLQSLPLAPALH